MTESWLEMSPDAAAVLLEDEALLEIVEKGSFHALNVTASPAEVRELMFELLDADASRLAEAATTSADDDGGASSDEEY